MLKSRKKAMLKQLLIETLAVSAILSPIKGKANLA